ncbi:MAG: redox-regulated ATPase YchF [Candidatus Cloacimonadota bacterium]|nr:redox-regulated ATPase YchF [Candidatus Cloacimonadota bacterium]
MIKIGLVGMPKSGKTTIFNAVTHSNAEVADYFTGKMKPNLATVKVADERIDYLSDNFKPEKTIHATIEYLDFVGIEKDKEKKEVFSDNFLASLRTVDSLCLVIRGFELSGKKINPLEDIESLESEFIISDLVICEKRIETISKQMKRGVNKIEGKTEIKLIEKCISCLNDGKPIRTLVLNSPEEKILRGFQFLTRKPVFVILNVDDDSYHSNENVMNKIAETYPAVEIAGKFEMEIIQLDDEEAEMFMEEYDITESAMDKLTRLSYKTLGLISFFTIGKDEVRAWTLKNGSTAVEAAGEIHSDLAQGFIRAERFSYNDFKEYGSEKELKEKGKFHLEGKEYKVLDGDILCIRHN